MSAPPVPTSSRVSSGRWAASASMAGAVRLAPPSQRLTRRRSRRLPVNADGSSSGPSSSSTASVLRSTAAGYPPGWHEREVLACLAPCPCESVGYRGAVRRPSPGPSRLRPRHAGGGRSGGEPIGDGRGDEPRLPDRDPGRPWGGRPRDPGPAHPSWLRRPDRRGLRRFDADGGPGLPGRPRPAGRRPRPRDDLGQARRRARAGQQGPGGQGRSSASSTRSASPTWPSTASTARRRAPRSSPSRSTWA